MAGVSATPGAGVPLAAAFQLPNTRVLRALGVTGQFAWAAVREGGLEVHGQESGIVRLEPTDIAGLRIGYTEGARRTWQLTVRRAGGAAPLVLVPLSPTWSAYRDVTAALVALLQGAGRGGLVELGDSKVGAALAPALFGLLTLVACTVSVVALDDTAWWARPLPAVIPALLCAITLRSAMRRTWPRPLRDAAELDAQMPPVPARRG